MSKRKSQRQSGCLIIFALPFVGVGVLMIGLTGWTLLDWSRMQNWTRVPAEILSADLGVHHDDDGTTYQAVARYRYSYEGTPYEGDRVALSTGADNLGSYHERKVDELRQFVRSKQPTSCYVNPAAPADSVLFRELRFEKLAFYLLFGLVFGGAGGGVLLYGTFAKRREGQADALQELHPDQPWRWRDDWAAGAVRSSSKATMWFAIFFAALWNLISSPLLFFLPSELGKENYLALIGLLFPVVGVGLASWAVIAVRRWLKFGESTFRLGSLPGVVGGPLEGVIETSVKLQPDDGFRQTLTCIRVVTSGSGDNRSTRERVLWQTSRVLQNPLKTSDPSTTAVPVQFAIPFDCEPTSLANNDNQIVWRLEMDAAVSGVDYHTKFEVPVFRTQESSEAFALDETAIAPFVRQESPAEIYRRCGLTRREMDEGLQIDFPLLRNMGATLGLSFFMGLWTGAIALMVHLEAPLFFPIVFGLFELLLGIFAIELWLWRSVLRVNPQGATLRAGLIGLSKTRHIPRGQIATVEYKSGMQSGKQLYYDLQLVGVDGKRTVFGKRVPSQPAADAIIADVKRALELADRGDAEPEFADGLEMAVGA